MKTKTSAPARPDCVACALARLPAHRVCLSAAAVLLAALAFGLPPARAAVTEAWVHRYNNMVNNGNDQASKVVYDAAGDVIVTGSTYLNGVIREDMLTIKYSGEDGVVLWQERYDGPANGYDHANAVAVDGSSNVVVTGYSYDTSGNAGYYTAKYAATDGALLWEQRYNGPANGDDEAQAVAVDGIGNVVVTGFSWNGTNYDYYTVKYASADGALLWEKRYDDPANRHDFARAVAVDSSGDVVVTGYSWNGTNDDYYTAKYAAADGALLWEKRYNGPANGSDYPTALAVDSSGNVVVTGSSNGTGSYSDYYTAKYAAADGALLWEKRYNGPANGGDEAQAVAVDGSGNVLVTGSSYNSNVHGDVDYYTAKYASADGAVLWEKRYNGPGAGYGYATAVGVDGRGNVVVTGFSTGSGSGADYYTAKYAAADGALLWENRYGPAQADQANALAVDGSGNVVVTGYSENGRTSEGGNPDYYTAKYAAADGALLWEKRYNGPANNDDRPNAVAVDVSGNVVVAGASATGYDSWWGEFRYDYYTAKYAAGDGALLWENRYNNAIGWDSASGLAVDGKGNVMVTGSYAMLKYAAADGALLWANGSAYGLRLMSVAKTGDLVGEGRSLVIVALVGDDLHIRIFDAWGNKVVDKPEAELVSGQELASLKELLNDNPFPGEAGLPQRTSREIISKATSISGHTQGSGEAVAVDGSESVVVTGHSPSDSYTAKYAATDGVLLWEKRSDGGGEAVTVDGSGNVVVTGSATLKYAAADGALLWANGGGLAVALDGSGNVVVTGVSTTKYTAGNGALVWEKPYPNGSASAVAVDGIGNVVVTGSSSNGTNTDYYTAKYGAPDGALLWEKRYNGPSDSDDKAQAVAIDGSGNVVVAGSSGNRTNSDFYTVKYASADGALLWEQRHDNGDDSGWRLPGTAVRLALGPNGMVAVTGSSSGDYVTVVYRELPPPLSFAAWAAGFGLSGAAAAADADPDNDGLPNGTEFILGGNPTVTGTSGRPAAATSGGNMVFTFPRDDASETPDVTLTVETGTDLMTWSTVFTIGPTTDASSPGVSVAENGSALDTITVTIARGADLAKFVRLRVTIAR